MNLLKTLEIADKLDKWANRIEPELADNIRKENTVREHIGHLSFYGSLLKALGNLPDLMLTWLRSNMPEQLESIQKDLDDLYEKARFVDHERSETGREASIAKCQAKAGAKNLAKKLRLLEGIVESRHQQVEIREKPAEKGQKAEGTEQNSIPAKTWAMLCKLYEITLKVMIDAVLDRIWPKPQ